MSQPIQNKTNNPDRIQTCDLKKGYRKNKLGRIPEDWNLKPLDELCTRISDGLHSTPKYVDSSNYYFINGNNLINNKIVINDTTKCVDKEEYIKHKRELNEQTILLSINGTIGNIAFYNNETVVLGKSAAYLNTNKNVSKKYVAYQLQTHKINNLFNRLVTGSTIKNLGLKSIKETKIPLPPLPEQKKIAQILSTWDKAIVLQKQLITQKQELKKGLMQVLLSGDVRFPGFVKTMAGVDGFSGEWDEVRLGDGAKTFAGGTPSRSKLEYYNGSIHWIKSGELNQGIIFNTSEFITEKGLNNSSAKMVLPNTLLIAMYGATAGVCAITKIKGAINQAVLAVIPNKNIDTYYLYQLFLRRMPKIVFRMVQGGQPNLSGGILNSVRLKIPSLKEQQKIAVVLSTADAEIKKLEEQLLQLQDQKRGLMQVLLRGVVRVKI